MAKLVTKVRIGAIIFIAAMAGFYAWRANHKPVMQDEHEPVEAMFDTDHGASAQWRAALMTSPGPNADLATIEAALSHAGLTCGADPTTPNERACTQEEVMGNGCTRLRIVRTQPWQIDTAQVVVACPKGAGH